MEQYVIYEQAILELKGLLYEAIDELEDTGSNDELLNKLSQGLCAVDNRLQGE